MTTIDRSVAAPPKHRQALVRPRASTSAEPQAVTQRSVASEAVAWLLVMSIGMFVFGAAVTWWAAGDLLGSIAVGGMCAVWGGPGFGVMVAGVRWAADQGE